MHCRKLLLLLLLLMIISILEGCSSEDSNSYQKAEKGTINLTRLQLKNNVVSLDGEWELYWNQLLQPGKLNTDKRTGYIDMPIS